MAGFDSQRQAWVMEALSRDQIPLDEFTRSIIEHAIVQTLQGESVTPNDEAQAESLAEEIIRALRNGYNIPEPQDDAADDCCMPPGRTMRSIPWHR